MLSPEALNTIQVVKAKIDAFNAERPDTAEHIRIYDRRWKKCVRLLRTSAFLNGRDQVDLMDCFLLEHCLWSRPDQRDFIREMLASAVRQHGYAVAVNLPMLRKELDEFEAEVDAEIRVRHTIAEDQLQAVKDEYYELQKDDQQFEGVLVSIKQFDGLSADEWKVTNLYDEQKNLVNRLKAKKADRVHSLTVEYNAREYTYRLRTKKVERQQVIPKTPHALLVKHWEDRYQQLLSYLDEQAKRLKDEAPEALGGLRDNLFVEGRLAELAEANQRQTAEAIDALKLRLDKLRYSYAG
jgi:MoxR-like ATPase